MGSIAYVTILGIEATAVNMVSVKPNSERSPDWLRGVTFSNAFHSDRRHHRSGHNISPKYAPHNEGPHNSVNNDSRGGGASSSRDGTPQKPFLSYRNSPSHSKETFPGLRSLEKPISKSTNDSKSPRNGGKNHKNGNKCSFCTICNVSLASEQCRSTHEAGKKHKSKLALLKIDGRTPTSRGPPGATPITKHSNGGPPLSMPCDSDVRLLAQQLPFSSKVSSAPPVATSRPVNRNIHSYIPVDADTGETRPFIRPVDDDAPPTVTISPSNTFPSSKPFISSEATFARSPNTRNGLHPNPSLFRRTSSEDMDICEPITDGVVSKSTCRQSYTGCEDPYGGQSPAMYVEQNYMHNVPYRYPSRSVGPRNMNNEVAYVADQSVLERDMRRLDRPFLENSSYRQSIDHVSTEVGETDGTALNDETTTRLNVGSRENSTKPHLFNIQHHQHTQNAQVDNAIKMLHNERLKGSVFSLWMSEEEPVTSERAVLNDLLFSSLAKTMNEGGLVKDDVLFPNSMAVPENWLEEPVSLQELRELRSTVFSREGSDTERLAFKMLQEIVLSPLLGMRLDLLRPLSKAISQAVERQIFVPREGVFVRLSKFLQFKAGADSKYEKSDKPSEEKESPEVLALCSLIDNLKFMFCPSENRELVPHCRPDALPLRGHFGIRSGTRVDHAKMKCGGPRFDDSVGNDALFTMILDMLLKQTMASGRNV